ncbi:hypothetical protein Tco_0921573, partial [Tanacetum coccineum]
SKAYKTYRAYATGEKIPKPKYVKNKADSESSPKKKTATTAKGKRLKTSTKAAKPAKKKQHAKTSKDKGLTVLSEVALIEKSSDKEDDDEVCLNDDDDEDNDDDNEDADNQNDDDKEDDGQYDEDQDDVNEQTYSDNDEESNEENDEESDEEIQGVNVEEEELDEEETNDEGETSVQTTQVIEDSHVIITPVNPEDFPDTTIAEPPLLSTTTLPLPPTPLITHLQQTPVPTPATIPSSSLKYLPNFGSLFGFDHRLKTLENNFSKFKQANQFATIVSLIPGIIDTYLAKKMNEAVKIAVQLQSDRLRDEAEAENEEFLNKLDDNIKKIIKDQVIEQVKAQVSKILLKIKKTINEQLEAKVLTGSSNESKTSYAISVNLSELELKKINIYKMESIDDEDKDEEPFAGSNRGSKRRRAGKEPESTSAPKEKTSKTTGKSTEGSKSHHKSAGESAQAKEPRHTAKDLEEPAHLEFEIGVTEDQPDEETSQLPDWFQKPAKPPTPDQLLAGPTFELMKGSCKSLVELEYFFEEVYKVTTDQLDWNNLEEAPFLLITIRVKFINNDLAYLSGGVSSRTYTTSVTKTKAADYGHIKWIEDLVPNTMWSQVPHNYKHLDWITVRRDDERLYNFKEGDFNRLRIQDIEDMLILLVQGKLTNLTILNKEKLIQHTPILEVSYQNKDKKNKLMCIDELHKFSDGTLNDVRTALNDRLKGIQMKYLPQTIWRQSDRDKAGAPPQDYEQQLINS